MIKIVVDSNIVFSAILNSESKVGQLILDGSRYFSFYSVSQLKTEIFSHQKKIISLTGYSEETLSEIFQLLASKIIFIDDILFSQNELNTAFNLVSDVDESDMLFVALTNHLKATLWTGDKKLITGLNLKEFGHTIMTDKLYEKYLDKQLSSRQKHKT